MTEEEKYQKKVYLDKANKIATICIIIMCISISTYIPPLLFGQYDFGIIFEITSIVCVIIAKCFISKKDVINAKIFIICAMLVIGWIFIYDIIVRLSYVSNIFDLFFEGILDSIMTETLTIIYLILLFEIKVSLDKAINPKLHRESTDWFYENYSDVVDKEKIEHKKKD